VSDPTSAVSDTTTPTISRILESHDQQ
jgi:hypothetical protein